MLKIKYFLLVVLLSTHIQRIFGEWNAQEYATSNGGQFKYALQELPKLGLKGSELILDVGCGNGAISLYIAREYVPRGEVEGLDNDNAMITCAVTDTEPYSYRRLKSFQVPLQELILQHLSFFFYTDSDRKKLMLKPKAQKLILNHSLYNK